ncbi:receptor-like protein 9DC3 isoform X1 [Quercus robur]|uniref:receptor-like protein 9DC3 isoform X1 n=1 Tax=Quercus robur TaxID=38942 RepID=UPI0021615800|nr:receptor-like protein 9DC3 isoform X1 [Quercus robur]XP_050279165.1 receptor-like protein 9DC3 isoform X1 [Quercus robur]XP_050279166.1 receptor-like protein 9DC3 isoform X1 [Quercus robur]XP_050279167.1 receptor-like protein 9DC3 isoform X1 [Quercus robur]XP_050279168.1 receptor-like protein 9DC3 isoform X1 [Quercus robur]XP_050279170.1 receptor-like protein 9DC3 isoform X1 [Quercus robur]XP_050279171.1 receptor-like protein 9DC3 isoform X1 [Quercus robur]XP_050279172.1 receptor-like pro
MVLFFLIFFLFLSLPNSSLSSFSFNSSTPLCLSDQSSALLHFRNSFSIGVSRCDDYYYPKKNSWKMGTDCCGWDGVTCDTMTGHVIGVDLSCSRLYGPIHPNSTLFSLRHLQRLNLAYNDFHGSTISSKFGGFANMTHLNLTGYSVAGSSVSIPYITGFSVPGSSFAGNVPSEISHLSKLVSLDLSSNIDMRIETPNLKSLIQNLTHLTELVLYGIDMSSVSTNCLTNLSSSLTSLRLSHCQLKGKFPENIFHLPNLQILRVGYNYNLTGSLPTYNWSTPLKSLSLSETEFPIDLPNLISNLKSLKQLSVGGCNFIGSSYPTFLSNLTQITYLGLSYSNFGGQCPWSLLNITGLTYLDLSYNNFIGQLPDFSSNNSSNSQLVNKIPSNLESLLLSGNLLNGTIPSWVYTIPSLLYLHLDHNQFTGHIGEFQHKSLVSLNVSFNNFSGNVESKIFSKLKSLQSLDMSNNPHLSLHSFTSATNILSKIHSLKLSSSNITEIPQFLRTAEYIEYLDLSNNHIKGNIPSWVMELGKDSLFCFSLSRNNLTGHIPSLICNLSSLKFLDFSYNHLNNMIPPCLGKLSDNLNDLNLQRNNLNGTVPATFAKGCQLRSLKLNGNQLEGALPQSLVHCRKLEVLDFGNNKISGTFPCWLESLSELCVLVLRSNNFHGAIGNPKTKFPFPNLRIIDLSHNKFHGLLPTKFFMYLKAMMNVSVDKGELKYMGDYYYQDSVTVVMKGLSIELVKIQSLFTTIDFSNNNFKGEIPKAIVELRSLKGLNFSHNNLSGHVPPSLGNLTNLEWLDLSSNKLTGEIPIQLADLTMLAFLNLSENYLFGHIPQGKQFNTFMNDSYYGNLGLCGFPMTKACGNDEGQQPSPSSTIQEDDFEFENGFHWKVVLLGYGCGFMFGLGLGYLVFSSGKPKWLVNIVYGGRHNKLQRS